MLFRSPLSLEKVPPAIIAPRYLGDGGAVSCRRDHQAPRDFPGHTPRHPSSEIVGAVQIAEPDIRRGRPIPASLVGTDYLFRPTAARIDPFPSRRSVRALESGAPSAPPTDSNDRQKSAWLEIKTVAGDIGEDRPGIGGQNIGGFWSWSVLIFSFFPSSASYHSRAEKPTRNPTTERARYLAQVLSDKSPIRFQNLLLGGSSPNPNLLRIRIRARARVP